jgi:hypothetical protein
LVQPVGVLQRGLRLREGVEDSLNVVVRDAVRAVFFDRRVENLAGRLFGQMLRIRQSLAGFGVLQRRLFGRLGLASRLPAILAGLGVASITHHASPPGAQFR